jgi:hypothetical protein
MLPVNYENHCQACHPLQIEPVAGKEIEHGLKPAEAREFLWGRYASAAKSGKLDESAERLGPRRPIPGRPNGSVLDGKSAGIDARVAAAERYLNEQGVCAKCHAANAPNASSTAGGSPEVEPANIPQVWLRHARFDHAAHRGISCAECHARAYPSLDMADSSPGPSDQDIVMIAGKDVCLKCHSPAVNGDSAPGASFDCVECHRYHDADSSLGGTVKRVISSHGLRIDQFLRGSGTTSARNQK